MIDNPTDEQLKEAIGDNEYGEYHLWLQKVIKEIRTAIRKENGIADDGLPKKDVLHDKDPKNGFGVISWINGKDNKGGNNGMMIDSVIVDEPKRAIQVLMKVLKQLTIGYVDELKKRGISEKDAIQRLAKDVSINTVLGDKNLNIEEMKARMERGECPIHGTDCPNRDKENRGKDDYKCEMTKDGLIKVNKPSDPT